jgi:signal transduction histidine kinase
LLATAAGPNIRLEFDLAGPKLVHVLADPTQLELAILNLTINARDAMPEGGTIVIKINQVRKSKEVRERPFEPFF